MGSTSEEFPWVWIPLVAGVLSLAALVVAMISFQRRRRGRSETAARACGRCGYDVRGLPTFVCPNCGSDLREVGIVSGPGPNAVALFFQAIRTNWVRMVVATVAVGVLVAGVGYVAVTWVIRHDVYPAGEVVLEPASKAYRLMVGTGGNVRHVDGARRARNREYPADVLTFNLAAPGAVIKYNTELRIDLPKWTSYTYQWVGGTSANSKGIAFDEDVLAGFFRANTIDTERADVRAELKALMHLIERCKAEPAHRVLAPGRPFAVARAVDKTSVAYGGSASLGPPLLSMGVGLWGVVMTGLVITGMWQRRDGVPSRANVGRDGGPAFPTVAMDGARAPGLARTVTVLFSDIKDYTARSAAGTRTGAIELVRRHRELAGPVIRRRGGTVVKTIGDALLVTFESATDAALAGLEIQAAVAAHNAAAAADEEDRLQLRIGVATGEVIVEAGDVYGESVNLASRLQGVATPGGVVLSAATAGLVNGREVRVEAAGETRLAGFANPVPMFAARA